MFFIIREGKESLFHREIPLTKKEDMQKPFIDGMDKETTKKN
jgi:hypothetical protein